VRQVPHSKADINVFAASIAAIGMLQYPVVEPGLARISHSRFCRLPI
jgi:hypothetical protein